MRSLILIAVFTIVGGILLADAESHDFNDDDNHNPSHNTHPRVKRNWPFHSSQQNADKVNEYYRVRSDDSWLIANVQKPLARYVGRSFGDEFPKVRDSLMEHQNQGVGFWTAHLPNKGFHPRNWRAYNRNNEQQERTNPYDGVNKYKGRP